MNLLALSKEEASRELFNVVVILVTSTKKFETLPELLLYFLSFKLQPRVAVKSTASDN